MCGVVWRDVICVVVMPFLPLCQQHLSTNVPFPRFPFRIVLQLRQQYCGLELINFFFLLFFLNAGAFRATDFRSQVRWLTVRENWNIWIAICLKTNPPRYYIPILLSSWLCKLKHLGRQLFGFKRKIMSLNSLSEEAYLTGEKYHLSARFDTI